MTPSSTREADLTRFTEYTFDTLHVIQIMVPTLGNAWYIAASTQTHEAVTIDAPRDPDILTQLIPFNNWTILAALDTHIHNDFLSGGPELLASKVIPTFHRPPSPPGHALPHPGKKELLPFTLGSIQIATIATPGHTPEHVSYCFLTADSEPLCVFSGGALMNGAIARPDLLGPQETLRLSLAAQSSLTALLELPGTVPVLPTHHGGSFCAATAVLKEVTTIEEQQQMNPLAQVNSWDAFLALHTRQGEYPSYFSRMGNLNRNNAYSPGKRQPLSKVDASCLGTPTVTPVDLRSPRAFIERHAVDALNIGYSTSFTSWAGWILDPTSPLILIADEFETASRAHQDLFRIGYENVLGWLPTCEIFHEHCPLGNIPLWNMTECATAMQDGLPLLILDVRMEAEWRSGHLPGAHHLLPHELYTVPQSIPYQTRIAVHCQSGYRSAIAASLLRRLGYTDVHYIEESPQDWSALGLSLVVE